MPGHSLAALTAYPWLGCVNNPESYEIAGWICGPGNVLCPGKESTFEFLENVLDEVLALFPSKLIHIGGDECQRTRWAEKYVMWIPCKWFLVHFLNVFPETS